MKNRLVLFGSLFIGCATALAGIPASSEQPTVATVEYQGKVVDEDSRPVSGIFPMTFKVYEGLKSKKAIWSETFWVAVDRGLYKVTLGKRKPLPKRDDLERLVLGVEIKGVGEVVREPFPATGFQVRPLEQTSHKQGGVKYAESAGYAVEAEHAKNADRLQNLTLEDLIRKLVEEGIGGAKVQVGKTKKLGNRVGGPGGTAEYNENCPKGYVMTGIKGGAGAYVDSIQIICSPIE
jgi:hypothetical protein